MTHDQFSNPRYPGLNLQESPGGRVLDAQRGHLIKDAMRELLKKVGWIPSRGWSRMERFIPQVHLLNFWRLFHFLHTKASNTSCQLCFILSLHRTHINFISDILDTKLNLRVARWTWMVVMVVDLVNSMCKGYKVWKMQGLGKGLHPKISGSAGALRWQLVASGASGNK